MEKMLISGVAKDTSVARISVIGVPDEPGTAFKLFSRLSARDINVDIILQSIGRDGTKDITFTVASSYLQDTLDILDNEFDHPNYIYDDSVAKVSIVGAGMETHAGVASKMFEALYAAQVNIQMIATSEIKVSVLIDREEADRAVRAIHAAFFPEA